MKGVELKVILGIIFLIVLLVLTVYAFINPVQAQIKPVFNQEEFWRYCAWWAQTDYAGTSTDYKCTVSGTTATCNMDMSELCSDALQLKCDNPPCINDTVPGDPNWERCKDRCRVSTPKV